MILALLLLYASLSDLKTRRVSDCVSIMIFILSLVGFEASNLPSMLVIGIVIGLVVIVAGIFCFIKFKK